MAAKSKPQCACCKEAFEPDPRNAHTQKFCTQEGCVLLRKQQRQSAQYRRKYATDKEFQKSERQRCKTNIRRRRQIQKVPQEIPAAPIPCISPKIDKPTPAMVAPEVRMEAMPLATWQMAVFGIVSSLTDADSPEAARASLIEFARRGQRVAV